MTDENVTPISDAKPLRQRPKGAEAEPVGLVPELKAKATPLIKTASQLDAPRKPADRSRLTEVEQTAATEGITSDQRLASIEAKLDAILAVLKADP